MTTTRAEHTPLISSPSVSPIYRPHSAVFWLYGITLVIGVLTISSDRGAAIGATFAAELELWWLWAVFVVLLLWLMFRFDPYRSGRAYPQVLVAGMALGGTIAITMSGQGNGAMEGIWSRWLDPETLAAWSASLSAPFIEEASKALCALVVLVLCAPVFNRLSQAMMLGMFVGFGFDLVEDLDYAANDALASLDTDYAAVHDQLVGRFLTAVPAHWAYTALATMGVMILLPWFHGRGQWSWPKRLVVAFGLMGSASLMHFIWDAPDFEPQIASIGVKVVVDMIIFLVPVLLLMRHERRWVQERIDAERNASLAGFDGALLDSLITRRGRRELRRAARRDGGRAAQKIVRRRQIAALNRIQTG